jgi:hypothetical protein
MMAVWSLLLRSLPGVWIEMGRGMESPMRTMESGITAWSILIRRLRGADGSARGVEESLHSARHALHVGRRAAVARRMWRAKAHLRMTVDA